MLKFKNGWLMAAVALAAGMSLPPSAEGSELAKLGRLIVTGKRAPSAEPTKPAAPPALPSVERARSAEPERSAVPARALDAAGAELGDPSADRTGEPVLSNRQTLPAAHLG